MLMFSCYEHREPMAPVMSPESPDSFVDAQDAMGCKCVRLRCGPAKYYCYGDSEPEHGETPQKSHSLSRKMVTMSKSTGSHC